ncbi:MAG: hypothetical protein K9H61_05745 [Bacteroidia bacterium]|nr:hypothetical protein [Bacteroidia bacterium]MCF8427026.1 hypothetical protein [Bacteroidia bacterium]MCF8446480.1 hypothetical protein [Bacteroidia bacterium]
MKNLKYLDCNELSEFDLIVSDKESIARERLMGIRPILNTEYGRYLNSFKNIFEIEPTTFSDPIASDLRGCYHIKTKARDLLLHRIINIQSTQFKHTCPYCLINTRSSFDHYVPEGAFPEFSILSRNLVPCCTTCNSIKKEFWRNATQRTIIHFYNDIIPNEQFLFGALTFKEDNTPMITFHINQNGINIDIYNIIQSHFNRFNLIIKYNENIDRLISDIIDDVESNRLEFNERLTVTSISNIIRNKSNRWKIQYGINYWKSVAMDELANSNHFIDSIPSYVGGVYN